MSELQEKVSKSIERLKAFEPPEGYYLAFSGGKDSVVCKTLLDMAGCKYEAVYRVTGIDPPELVQFIKEYHPDVKREVPRYPDGTPVTMWNLIERKLMPPTRLARYCCQYLKESGGDGRMCVTGVRWAESRNRKENQGLVTFMGKQSAKAIGDDPSFAQTKRGGVVLTNDNEESRRTIEQCYKRHKTTINPIIDWEDAEVWTFIRSNGIPYCKLYDEGFHRLGCIGCPMQGTRGMERDFARWPKYKNAYLLAFGKMLDRRMERHLKDPSRPVWKANGQVVEYATPMDVFNWWMEYDVLPGQITFDDYEGEEEI